MKSIVLRYVCVFVAFAFVCNQSVASVRVDENGSRTEMEKNSPKVAVVLSGGGAKGSAHVGALKVIERAGIPIDYIVGTSMGALVGAMYSLGYTTYQLDSIFHYTNWTEVMSDRDNSKYNYLSSRLYDERFVLDIPFKAGKPAIATGGGLIEGVNLGHAFHRYIYPHNKPFKSFNEMPIPYACVAVDITDGSVWEFHEGSLQDAMRSSMSIPGVFSPVRRDGHVFVDGGIKNNYPVDVAKKMGADIIIGVDVQADIVPEDKLKGMGAVLGQVIVVATGYNYFDRIDQTDIYVKVDVNGYTSGSFVQESIDTLMAHGYQAAMTKWDDLVKLHDKLIAVGRDEPEERKPYPIVDMETSLDAEADEHIASLSETYANSSVGVGIRYDNLSDVSMLMSVDMKAPTRADFKLNVEGRLGRLSYVRPQFTYKPNRFVGLNVSYEFLNNRVDYYSGTSKLGNIEYKTNTVMFNVENSWHKHLVNCGIMYTHYKGMDLSRVERLLEFGRLESGHVTCFGSVKHNSFDDRMFPLHGGSMEIGYRLLDRTDTKQDDLDNLSQIIHWNGVRAISPTDYFTILPKGSFRWLIDANEEYFPIKNLVGGISDGHVLQGQYAFMGAAHMQYVGDVLGIAGVEFQVHLPHKHHLLCGGNAMVYGSNINKLFDEKYWGVMGGYAYRSIVGPLSLQFHYSNLTNKVEALVNLGFVF